MLATGCLSCFGTLILVDGFPCVITNARNRPSLSGVALAAFGTNAATPLLGLGITLRGSNTLYGRHVPPSIAKSILPSVIAGYVIPAILVSLPIRHTQLREVVNFTAAMAPIYCAALVKGIAYTVEKIHNAFQPSKVNEQVKENEKADFVAMYQKKDVMPLKRTYAFAMGICAAVHIAGTVYSKFETHPAGSTANFFTGYHGLFGLASTIQSLYLTWEMRSEGFVTTKEALVAGLASVASSVALGPGAAFSGFFYWREHVMSSLGN